MPAPSQSTSASLLDMARSRRGDAWDRLVALYTPLLRAWLTAAGVQPADRDDLIQRAMVVLLRRLPDFEHNGRPGAFRIWLRGITVNLLRELWRGCPSPEADSILAQVSDPAAALSRLWDEQHDRHVFQALMEAVRPEFADTTWRAFRRVAIDGEPARAVAEELGLSVNAVLIAKSRVTARLRQEAQGLVE